MADWGIQNRIRQDLKFADAQSYVKKMRDIAKVSTWHQRQQKFQVARANSHSQRFSKQELMVANREIKERRRIRLRELLEEEARMYEYELASKGLAIFRDKL